MENFQILANWKEAKNTKDENPRSVDGEKFNAFLRRACCPGNILKWFHISTTLDCIRINDISEDFDDSIIQRVGHRLTCLNHHQSYKWKNGQIYF